MEGRRESNSGDRSVPLQRLTLSKPIGPDLLFGIAIALLFFATLVPRIAVHVLWRDELEPWMIAVDGAPSFRQLLHRASYEGHPYGWYIALWFAAKVWADPLAMKLVHAAVATASVFLIAAFAPAKRLTRVLIVAGYFFSFEYAVVSKNYAMGVTPLLAFAALRTWRESSFVAQAAALAAAAQGNVYSLMLVGLLSLWAGAQWLAAGRPHATRFCAGVALVAAGTLLAGAQLIGPPDRAYISAGNFDWSLEKAKLVAAGLWKSFVPVPMLKRQWWNSNVIENVFPFGTETRDMALLSIAVFVAACWILPPRRGVRLLWFVGASLLLAFGVFCFAGFNRHHGHLFILFFVAWWLSRSTDRESEATPEGRARDAAMLSLFVAQAIAGVAASIADIALPFSASKAVAAYIATNYPNALLIGDQDPPAGAVAGHLGRPIFFPRAGRSGTFPIWNTSLRRDDFTPANLAAQAQHLREQAGARPILYIVDEEYGIRPDPHDFRPLARFQESSIYNEQYHLYVYAPVDDVQSGTPPR